MEEDILKLDSVDKYNKLFGLETLHPQVSVIDLSKATLRPSHLRIHYGVYALYLKIPDAETSSTAARATTTRTARSSASPPASTSKRRWTPRCNPTPTVFCSTRT